MRREMKKRRMEISIKKLEPDPKNSMMADIIGNMPLDWLAMRNSKMLEDNWEYSVKLSRNPKSADQESTGTCWLQAHLSCLRYAIMQKYNVEDKFELSVPYLFFYDKIERSNLFLESLWELKDLQLDDPKVRLFTDPSSHMLSDGGCIGYALALVKKYGILPKNVYGKSYHGKDSSEMNDILIKVLNQMCLEIFRGNWQRKYFEQKKAEYNKTIFDLVVKFLGCPPKPDDKFTWTFKDKDGETERVEGLTAQRFYQQFKSEKLIFISDPRHPETYYCPSYSENSINMVGATPPTFINVPIEDMKRFIHQSLENDSPVWFACDTTACFDAERNIADTNRFSYSAILGIDIDYSKEDCLDMLTSTANHAMLFNGVDVQNGKYIKWRVQNSWGDDKDAEDEGYMKMSDDYFTRYVHMAAVDSIFVDDASLQKIIDNTKAGRSFIYKSTDVFACSSKSCKHCIKRR